MGGDPAGSPGVSGLPDKDPGPSDRGLRGEKRITLGEMEVPVAWLGRGTKAPLSPSGSCFGS